jgi:DNA-directed RNA polymerase subunit RPC12/RpoP
MDIRMDTSIGGASGNGGGGAHKVYTCPTCSKTFGRRDYLERHILNREHTHTSPLSPHPYHLVLMQCMRMLPGSPATIANISRPKTVRSMPTMRQSLCTRRCLAQTPHHVLSLRQGPESESRCIRCRFRIRIRIGRRNGSRRSERREYERQAQRQGKGARAKGNTQRQ